MKKILFFTLLLLPAFAFAHAVPESYSPSPGTLVAAVPKEVRIHLSEHPEPSVSGLVVTAPDGVTFSKTQFENDYDLVTPLSTKAEGVYSVTWRALSKDDGHFTTGSFVFAVGSSTSGLSSASTAVIPQGSSNERFAMTVELLGHGLLWAALFFALLFLSSGSRADTTAHRIIRFAFLAGGALIVLGGLTQWYLKALELAPVLSIPVTDAMPVFAGSQAGISLIIRLAVGIIFLLCGGFLTGLRPMLERTRYIPLFIIVLVFVAARSFISHALANPFYPAFSFLVNMVHLVEKDAWAGILVLLLIGAQFRFSRDLLFELRYGFERLLMVIAATIPLTATYIIWLHLKGFENLFTTEWGNLAVELLAAAMLLLTVRLYRFFAVWRRPLHYRNFYVTLLGLETGLALIVLQLSSVIISTTPPLHSYAPIVSGRQAGIVVSLKEDKSDDAMYAIDVPRDTPVRFGIEKDGVEQPIEASRAPWGGEFYIAKLLLPAGTTLSVTATPKDQYDQHFLLTVPELPPHGRTFDTFTWVLLFVALSGAGVIIGWLYYVPRDRQSHSHSQRFNIAGAVVGVVVLASGAIVVQAIDDGRWFQSFRFACEQAGGLWHNMPATSGGIARTKESREGCMISNDYHIVDAGMFDYYAHLPDTTVAWQKPARVTAGKKVAITTKVTDAEGKPATLWLAHERIGHMIAVNEAQTEFIHVHADQNGPVPQKDIDNATLTFMPTFPKNGKYILAFDYAQGIQAESSMDHLNVGLATDEKPAQYGNVQTAGNVRVELKYPPIFANRLTTLQFTFTKDGKPDTTLQQYLAAAAHIAIVKNDLSYMRHDHAEYHPPNVTLPPPQIVNGKIVHRHMLLPATFGPMLDVHTILPEKGQYTLWIEFQDAGKVLHVPFTIQVE